MAAAREAGLAWLAQRKWTGVAFGLGGFYVEMLASHFDPREFESISNGIEVASAVPVDDKPGLLLVRLFIPEDAASYFEDRIAAYMAEVPEPKKESAIAKTVHRIERIEFRSPLELVWTDPIARLPEPGVACWWEVWTRAREDDDFKYILRTQQIRAKPYLKRFPDRIVRWVFTTSTVLEAILANTQAIAELRRAYDVPSKILEASNSEQANVSAALAQRTIAPPADAPTVCLLDTGVNVGHPLLASSASVEETWAFNPAWGKHDGAIGGHGTQMAGLTLYGNLAPLLIDHSPIALTHRIESYKVVPDDNVPDDDVESYGHVFHDGFLRPEVDFPDRNRIFCSAVTSDQPAHFGLPSSWSGFIDEDCACQETRRLFIIAAGNLERSSALFTDDYPAANEVAPIFDPAQAWNALTVGAYTDMSTISDARFAGYVPLAEAGGLCPQSRTTMFWNRQWPIKPDIVLEGGNFARLPGDTTAISLDDLSVLALHPDPQEATFSSFGCTSGAAAQAAHMCAAIAAQYPDLWPETIRALMVHSAEHTPKMLELYGDSELQRRQFLARFGHGVPNVRKTLWSLQHDLTMIIQGHIRPFIRRDSDAATREIIYYDLPWPIEVLEQHAEAPVTLRVTLSYFVEPNPSRRGFAGRYRYASHGLRFAVRRPGESIGTFHKRVNKLEREDDQKQTHVQDPNWFLKENVRNRGCLISDSWVGGTAAQLADRGTIAIYPVGGWWKDYDHGRLADRETRFSLCVNLDVQDPAIDIYTPIEVAIANQIDVDTGLF